jgi:hypothetical protein
MESSSSVSAVDPEGTVAEVALELEGTDPSLLPNPDAEEPFTLREGPAARAAGHTVHVASRHPEQPTGPPRMPPCRCVRAIATRWSKVDCK